MRATFPPIAASAAANPDSRDAERWRVLCRTFGNERDQSTRGKRHHMLIRLNADGCEVLNPDGSLNFAATLAAIIDDEARIQAAAGVPQGAAVSTTYQFWLIERGPNQGTPQHQWWFAGTNRTGGNCGWKESVHDATQFTSAEEAQQWVQRYWINVPHAITSHSFMDAPAGVTGTQGDQHG